MTTLQRFTGHNVRVTFGDPRVSPSADEYLTGKLAGFDTHGAVITDYGDMYPVFIPWHNIATIEPEEELASDIT